MSELLIILCGIRNSHIYWYTDELCARTRVCTAGPFQYISHFAKLYRKIFNLSFSSDTSFKSQYLPIWLAFQNMQI